jgi:putative OPT family oligopeptide transporter
MRAESTGRRGCVAEVAFKPYVPDEVEAAELTFRAVALGALLGVGFGASSVYLALRVGLTVSASVPIAVLSISLFRAFSHLLPRGRATVLENCVVQTTGSAGESIAAGAAFTLPALVLLGFEMDWTRTLLLSLCGGILGVLMMIPLRRYLIVKEHGKLTYPEGTACAEVLIAGEEGGSQAKHVFKGLVVGGVFKFATWVTKIWPAIPEVHIPRFKASKISCDISPELMGIGYIIGYRSSAIMVGGGLLSWLVLIPAIALFGEGRATPLFPATTLISAMSPDDLWSRYIRYIGAGAVAAGGIINLLKALPTIVDSFRASFRDLRLGGAEAASRRRTERDIPISVVLGGCVALALFMAFLPQLKAVPGFGISLISAIIIIVFGFFFSVVSSRITGELGSSSNPISGMAIATLMGTCLIFILLGWTGHAYTAAALSIGTVVCIAASNAGTTSQDLKTSYLVGGTPWRQQLAIIVGVVTSVVFIGLTLQALNRNYRHVQEGSYDVILPVAPDAVREKGLDGVEYRLARAGGLDTIPDGTYLVDDQGKVRYRVQEGIGSEKAPAPQATLMSLVIKGILTQKLPWGLVLLGVFTSIFMEIIGVPALAFAVGMYLPLESTTPVFLGGLARRLVDWKRGSESESDAGPGVLYSSGLVAGGSIVGLAASFLNFPNESVKRLGETLAFGHEFLPAGVGFLAFVGVAYLIYRTALKGEAKRA